MTYCKTFASVRAAQLAAILASAALLGCSSAPKTPTVPAVLTQTPPSSPNAPPASAGQWQPLALSDLPQWGRDLSSARPALLAHCAVIVKRAALQAWHPFCASLQLDEDPRNAIQAHLQAFAQLDAKGSAQGLATAYYEPIFAASLQAGGAYQWPLYGLPSAAGAALPRKELTPESGGAHPALQGRELAWLVDPIDAYLVHVQGSTRLKLDTGSTVRIAYAGSNGQPFSSAANVLIQQGAFKAHEASNDRLRAWARAQTPQAVQAALNTNARFIFFKRDATPTELGPAGALGVPLTLHSVAVDPSYTPLGSLVWLDTPAQNSATLKLAQDTGSAIKGAARVDMYFGTGDAAGDAAGKVKHPARVWLLWPK